MRNTLGNFIAFAAGAAIGSAVAWRFLKKHYERIADEEIESMKNYYLETQSEPTKGDTEREPVDDKPVSGQLDIQEYADRLQDMEYTSYSSSAPAAPVKKKKVAKKNAPYVISPDEYAERKDYETVSLTYYADKVLANDFDEVIEDVDEVVGEDSLTRFGEYERDSVFVRDDDLKRDYEILLDPRKFVDVVGRSPHQAEE